MANHLKLLLSALEDLTSDELKKFKLFLSEGAVEGFDRMPRGKLQEGSHATDIASQMTHMYGAQDSLKITLHILREIKHNELAARLEGELKRTHAQGLLSQLDVSPSDKQNEYENTIKKISEENKKTLRRMFGKMFEGTEERKNWKDLNEIYTELYIIEGESEEVNTRHSQSRKEVANESIIKYNDIFHCSPGHRNIRTVITQGVAGVGKTVSVRKFILDWAEGKANQDIDFIFVVPFQELNLVIHDQYTLLKFLLYFHPEIRDVVDEKLYESKIIFIFDGLDESELPLNFLKNKNFSDVRETTSVDMLITNLVREKLLPRAYIWITSRPAAASQIPPEHVDRWTEIKGFNNQQKEEYFKNKIKNRTEADQVVTQIKSSGTLYVMCHMPIFCWILASVLQKVLSQDGDRKVPQTLTEIFIHFLLIQMNRKNQKYDRIESDHNKLWESNKDVILKFAELAFKQLDKGNILFTEDDCGIDFHKDLEKSVICTDILTEEVMMQKKKVFRSDQEFLATVFVLHSFVSKNKKTHGRQGEMLRRAVDESLQCLNGDLDLFLRSLLGMPLKPNQKLPQGRVVNTDSSSDSARCSVLAYMLLMSENIQDEFDLDKTTKEGHKRSNEIKTDSSHPTLPCAAAQPGADLLPERHTAVSAPPAASLHSAAGAGGGVEDGARGTAAQMMAEEQDDLRALLKDSGEHTAERAIAKAREMVDSLDHVTLNIAVTGQTGVGKSSFVNAIRGLQDTDKGAAPTGVTETTMEPTMYPHPTMPNVNFWDLPGIGTPKFKAETYMKDVKYQTYDLFIIVSASRFKENDMMLAKEIKKKKKNFYFVRSKTDLDVANEKRKGVKEEATLQKIRNQCAENLRTLGPPPVFLITSENLARFDFQELVNNLERDLPDHKRDALGMQSTSVVSMAAHFFRGMFSGI